MLVPGLNFVAWFSMNLPSKSVAVAKRDTIGSSWLSVFGILLSGNPVTVPVILIVAGVVVSFLITVVTSPHSLSCLFSPISLNAIFPPLLRAADWIFPESSLNVISISTFSPL